MEQYLDLLTIFGLSALEIWASVPLGFVLNIDPIFIAIASICGGIFGTLIVIFIGEKVRNWLFGKYLKKIEEDNSNYIIKIWNKYGVIGLGFFAPLLTGAPLGAIIGLCFKTNTSSLFLWLSIGIGFWSIVLTTLIALGINIA